MRKLVVVSIIILGLVVGNAHADDTPADESQALNDLQGLIEFLETSPSPQKIIEGIERGKLFSLLEGIENLNEDQRRFLVRNIPEKLVREFLDSAKKKDARTTVLKNLEGKVVKRIICHIDPSSFGLNSFEVTLLDLLKEDCAKARPRTSRPRKPEPKKEKAPCTGPKCREPQVPTKKPLGGGRP